MKEYVEMGLLLDAISVSKLDYLAVTDVVCKVPTADVVEVVRCKECKYRKFIDWGMGDCVHPKGSKHIAYDYHYCSYGERRKDEQIY